MALFILDAACSKTQYWGRRLNLKRLIISHISGKMHTGVHSGAFLSWGVHNLAEIFCILYYKMVLFVVFYFTICKVNLAYALLS
jgi:hypothetical protein